MLCQNCAAAEAEPRFAMPLCVSCRNLLVRRPFPLAVKLGALVILVAVVVAFSRSRESLRAGIAYERGQEAEKKADYPTATVEYQRVVDQFPDSRTALGRLGLSQWKAGYLDEALRTFDRLRGKPLPRALAKEIEDALLLKAGLPGVPDKRSPIGKK